MLGSCPLMTEEAGRDVQGVKVHSHGSHGRSALQTQRSSGEGVNASDEQTTLSQIRQGPRVILELCPFSQGQRVLSNSWPVPGRWWKDSGTSGME